MKRSKVRLAQQTTHGDVTFDCEGCGRTVKGLPDVNTGLCMDCTILAYQQQRDEEEQEDAQIKGYPKLQKQPSRTSGRRRSGGGFNIIKWFAVFGLRTSALAGCFMMTGCMCLVCFTIWAATMGAMLKPLQTKTAPPELEQMQSIVDSGSSEYTPTLSYEWTYPPSSTPRPKIRVTRTPKKGR